MYKKSVLPNGLRIVSKQIKQRESVSVGFWFGVGGRYEEDRIKGAAHYLEHIVFKGSKKYACEEIKERIEGVGGALNAFTSEEQTCFYAKIPTKHFKSTFDVLADMVFFPNIATKDVEKERTVILEEIKMYHDLPQYAVMDLVDQLVWPDHPLGKNIAGSLETVSQMSPQSLRNFHGHYYLPGNAVVSVCGSIPHDLIERVAKQKLGKVTQKQEWSYEPFQISQSEPRMKIMEKEIEQMHLALAIPSYPEDHPDRFALNILNVLLGGNMSSRLFVEVREKKGLAYSISSGIKTLHDTGVFLVRAGVETHKVADAVSVILKELAKVKRTRVPLDEFRRARDYLLGQLVIGLEDTMEYMLWIGDAMISRNSKRSLRTAISEYEKVKPADLQRVAKEIFQENRYNLALVGPLEKQQKAQLQKLLKVSHTQ